MRPVVAVLDVARVDLLAAGGRGEDVRGREHLHDVAQARARADLAEARASTASEAALASERKCAELPLQDGPKKQWVLPRVQTTRLALPSLGPAASAVMGARRRLRGRRGWRGR